MSILPHGTLEGVKVALLSDCFLPRLGGIEVQVADLAHHLQRAGHEVEVFTATGNGADRSTTPRDEQGIIVHRFDLGLPGGIPINPLAVPEVRRRLQGGGFDVAHVHMGVVSPFAVDAARTALGLGLPTAVTWHCVIDGSAPVHRALGYAARWAERGAALSAVSAMAADRVHRIVPPQTRVSVLPNGIDVARWRRPEGLADVTVPPLRIVAAQRMVRRKRPDALIDLLLRARELVPSGIALQAEVVGDGPAREGLVRRLEVDGVDWISLPGRVTRKQLRDLHWRSHVFVSAARLEAFGIASLEARTAGLALVVREGTGARDFVSMGLSGLLADTDDGLAEAVARLATRPTLLAKLQQHNRRVPPAEDWPIVVKSTVAEYRRAQQQATVR